MSKILYKEERKENKLLTGRFYAGAAFKSSGVRPGRMKVEVHIEQNRVFRKGQKSDSSQSFSNGLGV